MKQIKRRVRDRFLKDYEFYMMRLTGKVPGIQVDNKSTGNPGKKERGLIMSKYISKKLSMAIIGAAIIILNDGLGLNLPRESILGIAGLLGTYIWAQGKVDAAKK